MDSSSPAVEAEHLSKFYGQVPGLNDLSMAVATGEVRGLLGQNGSGKSTLLKTLLGLIHPSSGSARVLGVDVQKAPIEVRRLVGYVPESPRLYEFLTATEYLDFVADVRGIAYEEKKERITRLIESLDLEGKQGETILRETFRWWDSLQQLDLLTWSENSWWVKEGRSKSFTFQLHGG